MSTNSTKTVRGRISNKHGAEEYWILSVYTDTTKTEFRENPFVPLPGELIIYDPDSIDEPFRYKFGDGIRNVVELPFVSEGLSATHSWDGTTLTVTSASGTSSANLKGEKGDPYILNNNDKLSIAEAVEREIEIWRYQPKEDNTLVTENKEVVGAINELSSSITGNTWIMHDDLNKAKSFDYTFDFTSNGESFVRMKGQSYGFVDDDGEAYDVYELTYYRSNGTRKIMYGKIL